MANDGHLLCDSCTNVNTLIKPGNWGWRGRCVACEIAYPGRSGGKWHNANDEIVSMPFRDLHLHLHGANERLRYTLKLLHGEADYTLR